MSYLTDRKRATGMGSAKTGTAHHWGMTVSACMLLVLVPLFIFTFGSMLGEDQATVVAYYARPFPAIIAATTIIIGMLHFKNGVQIMIEDYVHGLARKVLIIGMIGVSYAIMATGLYGLAKIAF
ncbi:MAG: succinate dehydrogenase, hydrophobic membrane anchor protein [Paracoccaceae bacterium]